MYHLSLQGNTLDKLPNSMFEKFHNLEELDMQSCNLQNIDTIAWPALNNIVYVNIAQNNIKNINSVLTQSSDLIYLTAVFQ